MRRTILTLVCAGLLAPAIAWAQEEPADYIEVKIDLDSGYVENGTGERAVIFSTIVDVPGTAWLRLLFDQAELGSAPPEGAATILRVSSVFDGATQDLTAPHLSQWQNTSAFFNGDTLIVEIIADPGAAPSRVVATRAWAQPSSQSPPDSICGTTDDRVLSNDPRVARFFPGRCTIWIIDDVNHTLLGAGHCDVWLNVVEFNVPLSNANGVPQHPGTEDQYAYDPASVQGSDGGVGSDWMYFGCFPNTQTGLTPFEAQGDFFMLAETPPPVSGQTIRITGHGVVESPPIPPEWNRARKTHTGPYVSFSGTTLSYAVDTTAGNSGSPVINEQNGEAIGIHTAGGCDTVGANHGTGVNHPGLQNALAHPRGVCAPSGPIVAWGRNIEGQSNVPAPNTGFVTVAGGGLHTLGLKSDGSIVAWGDNSSGQLNVPPPNADFVAIARGADHSLGLKVDGSIVAWGSNFRGQLNVPAPNTDFVAIAGGEWHSLGLKADGSIEAWGGNFSGQLDVPPPNTDFVAIAAGWDHSLGLKADASIVAWGSNFRGQLNVPAPNRDFVAIAGGADHSLGLKADGSIVAWGRNNEGQLDVPPPNTDFVALAGGGVHSLGLKANGSIVAWGRNSEGQLNVPPPNADFVAVAAGGFHSLGIKPRLRGDLNCDGTFNGGDIDPFFLALGDPAGYAIAFPNCDIMLADMNGDGAVNGGDIDPFFACLGGNCP